MTSNTPPSRSTSLPLPRVTPAGDRTLLVEFSESIDAQTNAQVLALTRVLRSQLGKTRGLLGVVPAYRSLGVTFDPLVIGHTAVRELIERCQRMAALESANASRHWTVPVCYGGVHGEDLLAVAKQHQLDPAQVITMHSEVTYRVYMIGFLPGFAYLGGLHPALHTPRRAMPRTHTPAGSINIGGQQTAIASVPGPSGWHLLGRTPWLSFDLRFPDPFLFEAGDEITFSPINEEEFKHLAAQQADPTNRPRPDSGDRS